MYRESHYHSTTHECLGIFRGHAKLRFGVSNDDNPDDAIVLEVKSGDVIVVPAGVAHCALNESGEFCMVGAYPEVPGSLFSTVFILGTLIFVLPILVCILPFFSAVLSSAPVSFLISFVDGMVCVGDDSNDRVLHNGICVTAVKISTTINPKYQRSPSPKTIPSKAQRDL